VNVKPFSGGVGNVKLVAKNEMPTARVGQVAPGGVVGRDPVTQSWWAGWSTARGLSRGRVIPVGVR